MSRPSPPQNKDLVAVYDDTLALARETSRRLSSQSSVFNSQTTLDPDVISVVPMDTITAALSCDHTRHSVALLNMASYRRPGGGVKNGRKSQEEDLYRCTDLGLVTSSEHYPLKKDQMVVTTNVRIIKDAQYKKLSPEDMPYVRVIAAPAINLNGSIYDPECNKYVGGAKEKPPRYEEITKAKIRAILENMLGCDIAILGAWGCGVFKNKPEDMAQMFHDVLVKENRQHDFTKVLFAVIDDQNSHGGNLQTFQRVFSP